MIKRGFLYLLLFITTNIMAEQWEHYLVDTSVLQGGNGEIVFNMLLH